MQDALCDTDAIDNTTGRPLSELHTYTQQWLDRGCNWQRDAFAHIPTDPASRTTRFGLAQAGVWTNSASGHPDRVFEIACSDAPHHASSMASSHYSCIIHLSSLPPIEITGRWSCLPSRPQGCPFAATAQTLLSWLLPLRASAYWPIDHRSLGRIPLLLCSGTPQS